MRFHDADPTKAMKNATPGVMLDPSAVEVISH